MNSKDRLSEAMQSAFTTETAPPELTDRVTKLQPHHSRPVRWYALGATCAAASAVAAALLLAPSSVLADELLKQAGALQGHLSTYVVHADGSRRKIGDTWTENGKIRKEFHDRSSTVHVYDPANNVDVSCQEEACKVFFDFKRQFPLGDMVPPGVLTADTLSAFVKRNQWLHQPKTSKVTFNGRRVDCVTVTGWPYPRGGNYSVDVSIYANPETHKVLALSTSIPKEVLRRNPENVGTLTVVEPLAPPKNCFVPVFNLNGVTTNVYKERAAWNERLAKPLESFTVPGGEINVRSVTRNTAGDVFILYTSPPARYGYNTIPSKVTDSNGGVYVGGGGFVASDRGPFKEYQPFAFDGKPLEGAWFIHMSGGAPMGPVTVGFRKEGDPETKFVCRYTATPEALADAVPSYMPYMAMGICTPAAWKADRDMRIAGQYEFEKNFALAEQYDRSYIREVESKPAQSNATLDVGTYAELSRFVEEQGRLQEALQILLKAESDKTLRHDAWSEKQVQAALARLQKTAKR